MRAWRVRAPVGRERVRNVKLIRQLWYIVSPRERTEGALLLCAMALGALFEAVSISLVVPFIAILKDPGLVLDAPVAQPLLSALNIREPHVLLITVGLALVGAFVIKSGYLMLLYRWHFRYIFEMQVALVRQLLTGYLSVPYTFHLERNSAELIKVSTQTVLRFTTGFLVSLLTVLGELLVVAALITLLLIISPLATLGAVLALGVPTALIYRSMQRRLAEAGRLVEQSTSSMIQWTEQAISGIKETLIMDRAMFFIDHQGYHAQRFADSMRSMMLLSSIPRLLMDTLAVSVMVAMALISLARGQDMQSLLPVLGMFAVAAIRLMPSTSRIAAGLTGLRFHYAATEVLYNELRAIDGDQPLRGRSAPAPKPSALLPFKHSLVLEHLSYRYPSMSRPAIEDVSLEIPRGHWVALIGPTGAGKTTLVDLMLGLFIPTSGRIVVDGRNLHDNLAGWQRNIGYLPQSVYLMDDTVRRNVAFGLPDPDIDDERVWQALRAAQVDNLVGSLPGGLGAMIGERGDRLSGGERQRLGIARALYRDPEVLVVDEATANLDHATEAAIVDTLTGLRGAKTIIVIAHSLPLVRNCDRIYLLREGRLRNSGVYSDLVSTEPAFREFAGSAL
jgi:ABC-type multidrug transport system fused ATPase/permease subunit